MTMVDANKTLEQLEGADWGEPTFGSYLVNTCHSLRRKPLMDFTPEDLRIMIGQKIGLEYPVPIAIRALRAQPLLSGDSIPVTC